MNPSRALAVGAVLAVVSLSACGGGSSKSTSAKSTATTKASSSDSSGSSGDASNDQSSSAKDSRAGSVDVCALLSESDAGAAAAAAGLGEAGDTYKLTATKVDNTSSQPMSGCKFKIEDVHNGDVSGGGTVEIDVGSASDFAAIYNSGTPVSGLGDEAYRAQGATVVRVGDLMLSAGEDSFTDKMVVELYRKMIPHLK